MKSQIDLFPDYRPKSKKLLASEYGVSVDTIRKWCKMIKINKCSLLFPHEVREFYIHFGHPEGKEVTKFLGEE